MEDRLAKLVRQAFENQKVTIGRAAEILRIDLEAMRKRGTVMVGGAVESPGAGLRGN